MTKTGRTETAGRGSLSSTSVPNTPSAVTMKAWRTTPEEGGAWIAQRAVEDAAHQDGRTSDAGTAAEDAARSRGGQAQTPTVRIDHLPDDERRCKVCGNRTDTFERRVRRNRVMGATELSAKKRRSQSTSISERIPKRANDDRASTEAASIRWCRIGHRCFRLSPDDKQTNENQIKSADPVARRTLLRGVLCSGMRAYVKRLSLGILLCLVHCSDDNPPGVTPPLDAKRDVNPIYTIDQLKDPETCKACHQKHYDDWSGSMHAHASEDPLFLAMNERGQREANIGNFCVNCHAPMATAALGKDTTVDGAMLKALPKSQRGVTCYFCHNIDGVTGSHNNPLHLANDNVMRGRYDDAVSNEAHASAYSEYLDGTQLKSGDACGACHDIVNDRQAHIERTFEEWKESVFSSPVIGVTCAQCHVPKLLKNVIADGPKVQGTGVFLRDPHEHKMAAVDVAITDFPQLQAQKEAVASELNRELQTAVCVTNLGGEALIAVLASNTAAGHRWPSGTAQDRQLWFQVTAYTGGAQIYQSGAIPAGTDPKESADQDLWLIRDCMFDEQGQETHLFWDAKTYDFNSLPAQITLDPTLPAFYQTHAARRYPATGSTTRLTPPPDRVTLKVWLQAFPYGVYDELIPELTTLGYSDGQIKEMRGKIAPVQISANSDLTRGLDLEWTADAVADKEHGGQEFRNGLIPVFPSGAWVQCVTGTAMSASAQNVGAPKHKICSP